MSYDRAQFVIDGVRYQWSGYFGCQLESLERAPPLGTVRRILGRDMAVFSINRHWLIPDRVTWAVESHGSNDEHRARIESLRDDLRKMLP